MPAADTTIVTAKIDAALKAKREGRVRSRKRSKWQIAEIEAGIGELDRGEIVSAAAAAG